MKPVVYCVSSWIVWLVASCEASRVAIIGGGVAGTFAAKYLVDYDTDCTLDAVVVLDPQPLGELTAISTTSTTPSGDSDWQGSRVAAIRLNDGTLVELGASVVYEGFTFFMDMVQHDDNLRLGPPFSTNRQISEEMPQGLGIYDGNGSWKLLTSTAVQWYRKLLLVWRYNVDLWRVSAATTSAARAFSQLHALLESTHPQTFFESPDELWQAVGLDKAVHTTYDDLLDGLGVPRELPWWRRYLLPYQGCLRSELLTAINWVNYHQDNSQVNGVVGLASFMAGSGKLYSLVGGNHQVISSAFAQAQRNNRQACREPESIVQHVQQRVTTVVSNRFSNVGSDNAEGATPRADTGLQLFAHEQLLGTFDIVILAAPFQQSRITWLVQSHMDEAVLQPMPLGGMVYNRREDEDQDELEEIPDQPLTQIIPTLALPESVTRPYTQVVTTVVSNATLQAEYFHLTPDSLPRSIVMTSQGRSMEHNITAITNLTPDGVYKIFSAQPLEQDMLEKLFGSHFQTEMVKVWGGQHGGATPDYRGEGKAVDFLLYDSPQDGTKGAAIYYVNAIESSLACIEVSAMGAKAVSKLVAQRLGLITPIEIPQDEL